MSIRTNDFAFVFLGSNKFDIAEVSGAAFEIDTKPYEEAKKTKKSTRTLVSVVSGADSDLAPPLQRLMAFIRQKTGNRLDTIGAFCAVGTSNSCSLVLALAAELKKAGAPKLSYIGVTDVTIMPTGRLPAVPNVGTLIPVNEPNLAGKVGGGSAILSVAHLRYPQADGGDPPRVVLTGAIDAHKKRNFYQTQGNRIKLFRHAPRTGQPGWWWWSNMQNSEVHGEVEDFENRKFTVSGSTDDDFHVNICNRAAGAGWGEMLQEASKALADFPV